MIVIWEASDRIGGGRLRPLVPILVGAIERHGHLQFALACWQPASPPLIGGQGTGGRKQAPRRSAVGRNPAECSGANV